MLSPADSKAMYVRLREPFCVSDRAQRSGYPACVVRVGRAGNQSRVGCNFASRAVGASDAKFSRSVIGRVRKGPTTTNLAVTFKHTCHVDICSGVS